MCEKEASICHYFATSSHFSRLVEKILRQTCEKTFHSVQRTISSSCATVYGMLNHINAIVLIISFSAATIISKRKFLFWWDPRFLECMLWNNFDACSEIFNYFEDVTNSIHVLKGRWSKAPVSNALPSVRRVGIHRSIDFVDSARSWTAFTWHSFKCLNEPKGFDGLISLLAWSASKSCSRT